MRRCCEIQWIDSRGRPTPDTNPAIGEVWLPERVEQFGGRGIRMEESRRFGICAVHAEQLKQPDMWRWQFRRYPAPDLAARYRWHRANPSGACEVGRAAQIALLRAKAEIWANDNEITVSWLVEDGEWCAVAYRGTRVVAAIGGYEDEGGRAEEAAVLADAKEWCDDLDEIGSHA